MSSATEDAAMVKSEFWESDEFAQVIDAATEARRMQGAPLTSVLRMLLRVATSINEDPCLPVRVPDSTIAFLHRLGEHCDHSTKPLGRFLALFSRSQLGDEIIRSLLPAEFRGLREEL